MGECISATFLKSVEEIILYPTWGVLFMVFKDDFGVTDIPTLEELELFICHAGKERGKMRLVRASVECSYGQ